MFTAHPSFFKSGKNHIDLTKLPDETKEDTIDLNLPYGERREKRKKSTQRERRTDPVFFKDLHGTYDYKKYYEPSMDPKLGMNIKGVFAHLFWSFTVIDEGSKKEMTDTIDAELNIDESIEDQSKVANDKIRAESNVFRRVLVQSRKFQSQSGKSVPLFLPSLSDKWYNVFKSSNFGNIDSYAEDIKKFIKEADEMKPKSSSSTDESNDATPSNCLLGLRCFTVANETDTCFNIISKLPSEKLKVAPFETDANAFYVYNYARAIEKGIHRGEYDKHVLKNWMSTNMPDKPKSSKGFDAEASTLWFDKIYGNDRVTTLERVLEKAKNPNLLRPDKSRYVGARSLETDQKILDSLPEEMLFSTMCNSHNADQAAINKLANIAFGHDSSRAATDVLKLLLQDDMKLAKKKEAEEAKLTPEAKEAARQKKEEGKAKRKANKEAKEATAKEAEAKEAAAMEAADNEVPHDDGQEDGQEDVGNDSSASESTKADDLRDLFFSNKKTPLSKVKNRRTNKESKVNRQKAVRAYRKRQQKEEEKEEEEEEEEAVAKVGSQANDSTEAEAQVESMPTAESEPDFERLVNAYCDMQNLRFKKSNCTSKSRIDVGDLVILLSSSGHVKHESVATVLEVRSHGKIKNYYLNIYDKDKHELKKATTSHEYLYEITYRE